MPLCPPLGLLGRLPRRPTLRPAGRHTGTGHRLLNATARVAGAACPFVVRADTTDVDLAHLVFGPDAMYELPPTIQPEVIFDVGANIGLAAIRFALQYPRTTVYAFEPLPANLELLRENVAPLGGRVRVMPFGLSSSTTTLTYHMSDNPASFGGGTFCGIGCDSTRPVELPVRTVADVAREQGLERIDLFKLDCEGSELAVLEGAPDALWQQAEALVGELHGVDDWQLCDRLEPTHGIGIDKAPGARCYPFCAIRRDLLPGREATSLGQGVSRRAA